MERIRHALELDEDIALFKKAWIVHIVAWLIFYLLLALAAMGLFGNGFLSRKTVVSSGSEFQYERFLRAGAEVEFMVRAGNSAGRVQLAFPQHYLNDIEIVRFTPQPQSGVLANGHTVYTFSSRGHSAIYIYIKAKKAGTVKSYVLVNISKIPLSHLIYP